MSIAVESIGDFKLYYSLFCEMKIDLGARLKLETLESSA
jgi:hypothetical protein